MTLRPSVRWRIVRQFSIVAAIFAAVTTARTASSQRAQAAEATITPASSLKATTVSAASSAASSSRSCDADCKCVVRPHDQVWVLSTRWLGCAGCTIDEPPGIAVQKRTAEHGWTPSSLDEFFASDDPCVPTCIAIHGNQVEPGEALVHGMIAYCRLIACFPEKQPVRFVIWSWPSQKMDGILKDVRIKAARTPTESKYLAWVLNRINPETKVSLVGFSYGARIATGAMHIVAGGTLNGCSLPDVQPDRVHYRVVLLAAAMDSHWLADGAHHGKALDAVESMLLINNECDHILKRYRFIDRSKNRDALGYEGLAGYSARYAKVCQMDACGNVGHYHNWYVYFNSRRLVAAMQPYAWPATCDEVIAQ
jgi:hypothetical protein